MKIKKFVIIGPESTGKTELCKKLAAHFKTLWVAEYARQYLEKNGTQYKYQNLKEIAAGQLALEQSTKVTLENNKATLPQLLILDTNLLVIKVWSEYVFNKCDNTILTQIANQHYDGYLLCNTDIPWVKDNLREYPNLAEREKLFHYYKEELTEQATPWVIIKGNYKERTQQAIRFMEEL